MKVRIGLASAMVVFALAMALPVTASPDTIIYNNGGPGAIDHTSPLIDTANATSDTVQCGGVSCTPTDLEFWINHPVGGAIGTTVSWNFASGPNGGVGFNSGSSPLPAAFPCVDNGVDQQCEINITLSGTLSQPAHSWLTLTGLDTGVRWAFSPTGTSMAQTCILNPDGSCGATQTDIVGQAFNVSGVGTAVPEPSSLLLLGSGLLGGLGLLRRRFLP